MNTYSIVKLSVARMGFLEDRFLGPKEIREKRAIEKQGYAYVVTSSDCVSYKFLTLSGARAYVRASKAYDTLVDAIRSDDGIAWK